MVFLTLVIAVANLCLGYLLAVRLGYGPPTLSDGWRALGYQPMLATPTVFPPQVPSNPIETPGSTPLPPARNSDSGADGDSHQQPSDDAAACLGTPAVEDWDLDEKYVETSILKLNIVMMKSGARAADIDARLRACKGHSDAETIQQCLTLLKDDCATYLAEQGEASERFSARIGELGELSAMGEEITTANLEQAAQIETTLSNLHFMDFQSDLEAANQRLLEEIHNLRMARHRLRDNQEAAFVAIARCENRLDKIAKQLLHDPLTRLRNRIGLETELHQCWHAGRHQSQQLSALLFDLDNFSHINQTHGCLVGDRILFQIARFLEEAAAKGDVIGRFGGESFLVMMAGVGPQMAVKNAELLRQSIAKITFTRDRETIGVTIAGAISEVKPEDSWEAALQRLQELLKQAKQSGPNRLFHDDGKEAAIVASPNLGAKPREIAV